MTTVYNGFIEPDSMPQAYKLIESWNAKMAELNSQPSIPYEQIIDVLQKHNHDLTIALAKVERAVNLGAGRVVTAP